MAKGGKVEIEVELTGVQESEKELAGLAENGAAVGETFTSMGDAVSTFGGEANEALGSVGGAAGDTVGAFMELGGAVKEGELSFAALAGPIGIAVAAVYALVQAFREYTDEVNGVTAAGEAYLASLGELTSAVEELAAAGVELNETDVEELHNLSMKAKLKIEQAQIDKERAVEDVKKIKRLENIIAAERKRHAANVKDANDERYFNYQRAAFHNFAIENLKNIEKAQAKVNRLKEKNLELIHETSRELAEGARDFLKFEQKKEEHLERSTDALKKRAQQELALQIEMEADKISLMEDGLEKQLELETVALEKRMKEIRDRELSDKKLELQALNSAWAVHLKNIERLEKADQAKRRARREKRLAEEAKAQAMIESMARQELIELDRIEQLKIQLETEGDEQLFRLAEQRMQTRLELTGDNARAIEQAELEHQLVMSRIQSQADQRRASEAHTALQAQIELEQSTREFDAQRIADETTRELELLSIRYDKELAMARDNQEKQAELERRYAIEKTEIQSQAIDAQITKIGELTTAYGAGFAEAAIGALFFGESFQEATAQILMGLSRQFAVQALGKTAEGVAALILNPAAAGPLFKSAAIFSAAALAAGGASAALGGGGGGGGVSASPSGSPQEAPTPERERAEEVGQVFNINFGGAVIYDTRQAAEQALADRVASMMATPRRGQYRRSR